MLSVNRSSGSAARTVLAALLTVVVAPIAAGQAPLVPQGSRIHVRTNGSRDYTGALVSQDAESLSVLVVPRAGDPGVVSLALSEIASLEVSRDTKSHAVRGAVIGLAAGAGAGGAVGGLIDAGNEIGCGIASVGANPCTGRHHLAGVFAAVGAGLGGLVGLVVGASSHSEVWETVPLHATGIRLTPQPGGRLGIGMSIRLGGQARR